MVSNTSSQFSADVSAYKGDKCMKFKPKALKGKLKQTEGKTPRGAMPEAKKAGKYGSRMAKIREKRLEKEAM